MLRALDQGDLQSAVDHAEDRDIDRQRGAIERRGVVGGKEVALLLAVGGLVVDHGSTPLRC
jgi:hypothetical protein